MHPEDERAPREEEERRAEDAHLQEVMAAEVATMRDERKELAILRSENTRLKTELDTANTQIKELEGADRSTCTERDIENLSMHISCLFSPRTSRALQQGQRRRPPRTIYGPRVRHQPLSRLWQVVIRSDGELLNYAGLGRQGLTEIKEVLREFNLITGMRIPATIEAQLPQPNEG